MSSEVTTREGAEQDASPPAPQAPTVPEPHATEPGSAPALPSIIVDHSLMNAPQSAARSSADRVSDAVPNTASIIVDPSLMSAPAEPAVAAAAQEIDFDAISADRFAAAYRPSWESAVPVVAQARSPHPAAPIDSHRPTVGATLVTSVAPSDVAIAPSMRATRNRALVWIVASVVGFVVLAYLGISSSRHEGGDAPTAHEAAQPSAATEPTAEQPAPMNTAPSAAATATPEPSAAPAPEAAPVAPAPEPPPSAAPEPAAPQLARLSVTTQPASAELQVDGRAVANPYAAELEIGSDHQLLARASGYLTDERSVRVAGETEITIALEAKPAPAPVAAPTRAAPAPRVARAPAKRKPAPAPAPRPAAKPKAKRGAGFVADSPY